MDCAWLGPIDRDVERGCHDPSTAARKRREPPVGMTVWVADVAKLVPFWE